MSTSTNSTVIPGLRYQDAHAAIDWLCRALGFVRHAVYEGPNNTVAHAQLTFGATGMIMLGSATNDGEMSKHLVQPSAVGNRETQAPYLITSDATALYHQAKAAGAEILMDLREMDYGGMAFSLRDPEGHNWSVGEYNPWASPSSKSD